MILTTCKGLSDSSSSFSRFFIVEIGQSFEFCFCLVLRQVLQAEFVFVLIGGMNCCGVGLFVFYMFSFYFFVGQKGLRWVGFLLELCFQV